MEKIIGFFTSGFKSKGGLIGAAVSVIGVFLADYLGVFGSAGNLPALVISGAGAALAGSMLGATIGDQFTGAPAAGTTPGQNVANSNTMAQSSPNPKDLEAEVKNSLRTEAQDSANGLLYRQTIVKPIKVPVPGFHTSWSSAYYDIYLPRSYATGYMYDRRVVQNTATVYDHSTSRAVNISYPSPGDASPDEVLREFFRQNLYKQNADFGNGGGKNLPLMHGKVQRALSDPSRNRDEVAGLRENVAGVDEYLSRAEQAYIKKINDGNKNAALETIAEMMQHRANNAVLEKDSTGKNNRNFAHMVTGLAVGNGTKDQNGYDGSARELFYYFEAIERNKNIVLPNGQKVGDFFARVDEKNRGYNPTGERVIKRGEEPHRVSLQAPKTAAPAVADPKPRANSIPAAAPIAFEEVPNGDPFSPSSTIPSALVNATTRKGDPKHTV